MPLEVFPNPEVWSCQLTPLSRAEVGQVVVLWRVYASPTCREVFRVFVVQTSSDRFVQTGGIFLTEKVLLTFHDRQSLFLFSLQDRRSSASKNSLQPLYTMLIQGDGRSSTLWHQLRSVCADVSWGDLHRLCIPPTHATPSILVLVYGFPCR